jgi:hypothetical protein
MKNRGRLRVIVGLLLCLASATTALAKDNPTYTQWGRDITVGPDDETGELTCIACTVRIRGQVAGDVTTIGGSIVIEDHGQVTGDVTSVGGNVRLDSVAKVTGDVTVVGGTLHRDPEVSIGGDVASMGGQGWMIPILLFPFLLIGALIAFVVWLVQRLRRSTASAPAL